MKHIKLYEGFLNESAELELKTILKELLPKKRFKVDATAPGIITIIDGKQEFTWNLSSGVLISEIFVPIHTQGKKLGKTKKTKEAASLIAKQY